MEKAYYIDLHLQTPQGFEIYGTFQLGKHREKALAIFSQLRGTDVVSKKSILHMDLTEMTDGVPLPIRILHCTIDDVAVNTRTITRDVFKNLALESD